MKKLLFILLLFGLLPQPVNAGSGFVWCYPKGATHPQTFSGDSAGFGNARDLCIKRGGGLIQVGPGMEGVTLTYPANANILVMKFFTNGLVIDPFSSSLPLGNNLEIDSINVRKSINIAAKAEADSVRLRRYLKLNYTNYIWFDDALGQYIKIDRTGITYNYFFSGAAKFKNPNNDVRLEGKEIWIGRAPSPKDLGVDLNGDTKSAGSDSVGKDLKVFRHTQLGDSLNDSTLVNGNIRLKSCLVGEGKALFADTIRTNKALVVGAQAVTRIYRGAGTLNFDLTAVVSQDLTISVTGAAVGDEVFLGVPNGSVTADTVFYAWVSATDTVTVRASRTAGTPNPASGSFKVTVFQ